MPNFKAKPFKAGSFVGSWYSRGGITKDKHGNVTHSAQTLRNVHSGLVVNAQGNIIGAEKNRHHNFGNDPRRVKVGVQQTAQKKAIMAHLRQRGKIR